MNTNNESNSPNDGERDDQSTTPPNTTPNTTPTDSTNPDHRIHRFVWGFGLIMVIIAGGGFIFKLYEFLTAIGSDAQFQFSIIPVMTYLIVAAGFGCLFMWGFLAGQFKDIEEPKFRMLEMQDEFDKQLAASDQSK